MAIPTMFKPTTTIIRQATVSPQSQTSTFHNFDLHAKTYNIQSFISNVQKRSFVIPTVGLIAGASIVCIFGLALLISYAKKMYSQPKARSSNEIELRERQRVTLNREGEPRRRTKRRRGRSEPLERISEEVIEVEAMPPEGVLVNEGVLELEERTRSIQMRNKAQRRGHETGVVEMILEASTSDEQSPVESVVVTTQDVRRQPVELRVYENGALEMSKTERVDGSRGS